MGLLGTQCYCRSVYERTGTIVVRVDKNPVYYQVMEIARDSAKFIEQGTPWDWIPGAPGKGTLRSRFGDERRIYAKVMLSTQEAVVAEWFASRAADWQPTLFGNWLGGNANVPPTMGASEGAWRQAVARFWDTPQNREMALDFTRREVCFELMRIAEEAWESSPAHDPDQLLQSARADLIERGMWPRAMPPPLP